MKIAYSVESSHEAASLLLADQYMKNLKNYVLGSGQPFLRLDKFAELFRHELADRVYRRAAVFKASRIKYRPELVVAKARDIIRAELISGALLDKLSAIRRESAKW